MTFYLSPSGTVCFRRVSRREDNGETDKSSCILIVTYYSHMTSPSSVLLSDLKLKNFAATYRHGPRPPVPILKSLMNDSSKSTNSMQKHVMM